MNEFELEAQNYNDAVDTDNDLNDLQYGDLIREGQAPTQDPNQPQASPQAQQPQGNAGMDQGFLPDNPIELVKELGKAAIGGTTDAVDSVGSFLDLSGDTIKTGIMSLFGRADATQNPFSKDYESGAWWDIPDDMVPENESGLGQLTRGLVEFGLLAYATGGAGVGAKTGLKAGRQLYKASRLAGFGKKGAKYISFVPRTVAIAGEGAMADLISNSSESANIANLVNEYAPFIPFSEALAVDPEKDTAWIARIKTVAAGSGLNLAGHFLASYVKNVWGAHKNVAKGMDPDEANVIANANMEKEIPADFDLDEKNFSNVEAYNKSRGLGISNRDNRLEYVEKYLDPEEAKEFKGLVDGGAEPSPEMVSYLKSKYPDFDPANYPADITRQLAIADYSEIAERIGKSQGDPWFANEGGSLEQLSDDVLRQRDPFVDSASFPSSQKADLRPNSDSVKKNVTENLAEGISMLKKGKDAGSPTPIFPSTTIKRLALGDKNLMEVVSEVADELSEQIFKGQAKINVKGFETKYTDKELKRLILQQTTDLHATLADGGDDVYKSMKDYLEGKGSKDFNLYAMDGDKVITISPVTRAATQLLVTTLAHQVRAIATGAVDLGPKVNKVRQQDMIFDMMKVLMLEQKKSGFMAGNNLRAMKNFEIGQVVSARMKQGLDNLAEENEKYFTYLAGIRKTHGDAVADQLHELHMLSDGVVQRLEHIHKFLEARTTLNPVRLMTGTMVNGTRVKPRLGSELSSVYYNSLLSNLRTPSKAVFSTNMVALARPFQAYLGAVTRGNQKEALIAASMMNSIGASYAEGIQAFKHNWDLGVNRKAQSYAGKFELAKDIDNFRKLESHIIETGDSNMQRAYGILDTIVGFNTSPIARYSVNLMGAGDALARTVIGRMEMRMRAARSVIDDAKDLKDLNKLSTKIEENFRDQIFTKDKYNQYVVTDNAASLAGDEAALTTALPKEVAGLETIQSLPLGQFFFPFVRTGYNALRLTWAHTELERFSGKFQDVMFTSKKDPRVLEQYGIRIADVEHARALMRGRMSAGNSIVGLTGILAMSGFVTGDMPYDNETRQLWKQNGIQPNSFTIPGSNIYVSYRTLEPFNTIISATANLTNNSYLLGESFRDDAFQKLVFMAGSVIVDKSMLAGVDDLVTLFSASQQSGVNAQRVLGGLFRRTLPYYGLLSGLGDAMQANEVEANNFAEEIIRRDLLFKKNLHPSYDILNKDRSGVPFVPSPTNPLLRMINMVSPIAITFADKDPVKEALLDINFNIPSELTKYKGEPLTSEERSKVQKFMSQDVAFRRNLEEIVSNPQWQKAVKDFREGGNLTRLGGDPRKTLFYSQVRHEFANARQRAFQRIQAEMPDLMKRVNSRIQNTRNVQMGKYNMKELQKHGI